VGVSREGGTERGRLCSIERLDQNRDPHHELAGMRGEMGSVVDALIAAGLRCLRRGDGRAEPANGRCLAAGRALFRCKGARSLVLGGETTPSGLGRRLNAQGSMPPNRGWPSDLRFNTGPDIHRLA
jgi:hypothetical protein